MTMNSAYLGVLATAGKGVIKYIGLVDDGGVELSSSGYARKAVTLDISGTNLKPPNDLVFDTDTGDVVAGWHGFSALTAGTDYDGAALTKVTFSNPGTYTLQAASTAINHSAS